MSDGTHDIREIIQAINGPQEWEQKIDLIRRTVAAGASPDELELFFHQAKRAGLDPLAKQIYFVKRQGKGVVQVGIDGLRLIADRTGKYAGSDDAEFSGTTERGFPGAAKVTVYKMVSNQRCPFSATARWEEYFPGDQQGFQWKRMPHAMLSKCAEALALRKAFPADMSGLYVHEEMEQAGQSEQPPKDQPQTQREAMMLAGYEATCDKHGIRCDPAEALETWRKADEAKAEDLLQGAFGYVPEKMPSAKAMGEPRTPEQAGKAHAEWKAWENPEELYAPTRKAVLACFGFDGHDKKGHMMLWIDFLMKATPEQMSRAMDAANKALGQEALL